MAALLLTGAAQPQTPGPGPTPRMRAIVYRSYGSPEVLRLEEIERPVPKDDQVLVRIRAASVNPLDCCSRRRSRGSASTSLERSRPSAGNATRFRPGDAVFGHRFGASAEYVVAAERSLVAKPTNATFEPAASIPVAGVTALQGLRDHGRIRAELKVLVNGASGGVGTFAVQIAKSFGAEVTGVCSTRNVELVRSIGADQVVDYTREDFTKGGAAAGRGSRSRSSPSTRSRGS